MAWARRAASTSPSPAATIEPFMRMCHWRAKGSGSGTPASRARSARKDRMLASCSRLAWWIGCFRSSISSRALTKRQPSKLAPAEPAVEHVEDGQQALGGVAGAALDLGDQPSLRPQLLAALEDGEDEVVLGAEVAVEGHLGHAGLVDDRVDADRADAVAAEEPVRGRQDALAGLGVLRHGAARGCTAVHLAVDPRGPPRLTRAHVGPNASRTASAMVGGRGRDAGESATAGLKKSALSRRFPASGTWRRRR